VKWPYRLCDSSISNNNNNNKYCVSEHYPSSCFYLKQRFGDWILSPSSGGTFEGGDRLESPKRFDLNKNRTMDNVQKHNISINTPSSQTLRINSGLFFPLEQVQFRPAQEETRTEAREVWITAARASWRSSSLNYK
jgi:hypothetical protein